MVKTKREYILAAGFTSGIALVLSVVSTGTTQWVVAEGEFSNPPNALLSEINYGLFSGTYLHRVGGDLYFNIYGTCLISENVCAYLCKSTSELRKEELQALYRNEVPSFGCPSVRRRNSIPFFVDYNTRQSREGNHQFINAGMYLSTIVFLQLSSIFGLIATALSVWNTAGNPVEVVFSIYGIYIYNLIACISSMMTLILWGALFALHIVKDIGIYYTIVGDLNTNGMANLGFSYWLNVPSTFLYATSIFILYWRQHLINQEPEIKIHVTSDEQGARDIMIF